MLSRGIYGGPSYNNLTRPSNVTEKNGLTTWKNLFAKTLEIFLDNSSIHGIKYLHSNRKASNHWIEKAFWGICCFLAFSSGILISSLIVEKWNRKPMFVSFDPVQTPVWDIPFPAITICNVARARKSEVEKVKEEILQLGNRTPDDILIMKYKVVAGVCPNFPRVNISTLLKADLVDDAQMYERNLSQPCSSMIKDCKLNDHEHDCKSIFHEFTADHGECCSFNIIPSVRKWEIENGEHLDFWSIEKGYVRRPLDLQEDDFQIEVPFRTLVQGVRGGLSFSLDSQADEYGCRVNPATGFRIMAHNPISTPLIEQLGLALAPGQEHFIRVNPEMFTADKTILAVSPKKRLCFAGDEKVLKYYQYYSLANCVSECRANITLSHCECVPTYMPRDKNLNTCGPDEEGCIEHSIHDHSADIYEEHIPGTIYAEERDWIAHCGCKPSCIELDYDCTTTSFPLQADDFPNYNSSYVSNNLAKVHVFYARQGFFKHQRGKIYDELDFFSNIGGIIGLCMGVSIISVMEMIYFFTIWMFFKKKEMSDEEPKENDHYAQTIQMKMAHQQNEIQRKFQVKVIPVRTSQPNNMIKY